MAAKRRRSPPPPPPTAAPSSSSDEDSSSDEAQYIAQRNPPRTERDDDESDSDSGSESDTDTPTKTLITPQKPSQSEDSSEEYEEEKKQELKSPARTQKTPQKLSKLEDSSGEDEEVEEQEEAEKPKLLAKTLKTSQKLSESEEDSDEEEEEEEEQKQVEKLKSPAKEPESQPDKKKLKLSTPDQSPSNKSSFQRIWSVDDEMVLLRALSEYQVRNGKLPPRKDYASFLSGISGFISFPVTETQLFNKIRQSRQIYSQKKKKGSCSNFSQPHEKAMFDLYTKLFEATSKVSKKRVSPETSRDVELESGGKQKKGITEPGSLMAANGGTAMANGGVVNGTVPDGSDAARSHFYIAGLIKDMIHTKQCPEWLSTVEDVVALIGESRVKDLEAKTKMLRIDKIKLQARKEKLIAELFDILADEMVGN